MVLRVNVKQVKLCLRVLSDYDLYDYLSRCSLQCLGLGGEIFLIKVHEWIQDSGVFRSWTTVVEKILASPE